MNKALQEYSLVFVIILILLAPWFVQQIEFRIPGDAAFLYTGAEHFLSGKSMVEYYYDTNPPMSFMIFLPAVVLQTTGLDAHHSIYIYTFALIVFQLFLLSYLLPFFKISSQQKVVIITSYLATISLLSFTEFSQKDHLIAIVLPIFLLAQFSSTLKEHPNHKLLFLIFFLLTPFILIKPNYGLLPLCVMIYRVWHSKTIGSFFGADFFALAFGSFFYILAIYFYFPDYISEIVFHSFELYIANTSISLNTHKKAIAIMVFCFCLGLIAYMSNTNKADKKLLLCLITMSFLSAIPFWIQNKGFSVHLLPSLSLLIPSLFSLALILLPLNQYPVLKNTSLITFVVFILIYPIFIFGPKINTKSDFQNSTLAKLIEEQSDNRPFLFQSDSTNVFQTQTLYIENSFGSRFPSLWFVINLHNLHDSQKKQTLVDEYARYFSKDLEKFKPGLVGLIQPNKQNVNAVIHIFKGNQEFKDAWRNYKKSGEYTLKADEFTDFFIQAEKKDITYDLYKRIK